LGYGPEELRKHLEKQFAKGMTWGRFLSGDIHIDHIVPVRDFSFTSPSDPDFRACWALTNLRPLWAEENRAKRANRTHLI
jgi:hypothetical protein